MPLYVPAGAVCIRYFRRRALPCRVVWRRGMTQREKTYHFHDVKRLPDEHLLERAAKGEYERMSMSEAPCAPVRCLQRCPR